MEAYKRIRHLRKSILEMTLEEFASKINMSGSNLGNIETGRIGLTDRVLSDICRTFNIRQKWLEEGTEPIFEESIDSDHGEIIELYSSLSERNRLYLLGYMQRLLEEQEKDR